jgi:hypothetical protein
MMSPVRWWAVTVGLLLVVGCSKTSTVVTADTGYNIQPDETGNDGTDAVIIGPVDDLYSDWKFDLKDDDTGGGDQDVVEIWFPDLDLVVEDELVFPDVPDVPDEVQLKDVPPEIPDVKPDLPECIPQCDGKECGSDNCTGVCGYCAYGYLCDPDNKCVTDICPKQCTATVDGQEVDKECGSDSCGGYCGYCINEGEICGDDGFCYQGSCTPDCEGKVCGPDTCGGSCGFCQAGELCDDDQQCVPHPCGTVGYKGKCEDKYKLVECINLELVETVCLEQPDMMCGWDQNIGKYTCVPETECEPQCLFEDGTPKECGPDGCWSSCGVCAQGWGCGGGICQPAEGGECAWVDGMVGVCFDDVKWFCSAAVLYAYDCMDKEGKTCGWNQKANFGLGGYDCM